MRLSSTLITPLLLAGPTRLRTALHDPRLSSMRMTTDGDVEIVDTADDRLRFSLADSGDLQLFMADELFCPLVRQITYEAEAGFVATDGVTPAEHGEFTLLPERRSSEAAQLKALSEQATSCEWREPEDVFALPGEAVVLPPELEALLVDDTLKSQRPQVRLLWSKVLDIYPSDAAALAAVQRNSALVLPYLNRPGNIVGSWQVINQLMGPDDALEVVTQNPGVLCTNPQLLARSNEADIKRAAGVVDAVEALPMPARYALAAGASAAAVWIVAGAALQGKGVL